VKEGNDEGIDEWIRFLKNVPNEESRTMIVNQFEGGSNAVHMATIKNDSETLKKLFDVGGGMHACMYIYTWTM